ncbi:MAG: MBL fold metallo-hydrolase [Planctomycetes bacterium]|nr:MBL fold metallo-hydrolase [Planctomycetota bacterium]
MFTQQAQCAEIEPACGLRLCVLASGSSGNCSVLVAEGPAGRHVWLIDAGLSLRRTRKLLQTVGLDESDLRGILLTHLDDDHANAAAIDGFGNSVPVFVHRRHLRRAEREGRLFRRTEVLHERLPLAAGCTVEVELAQHDTDGSAVLRFTLEREDARCELGYATDIGHPTQELIAHLRGVDVLAIESNYCPHMQESADRPAIVKSRVTGGRGHLSNQQCRRMTAAIAPRAHVVLLHLSRQCNTPELAAREHHGAGYELSLSSQFEPTGWITASVQPRAARVAVGATLFDT